jgi:hypothetical protein
MSYDVSLAVDCGGAELMPLAILDANYTWNVSPMFVEVVGSTPNGWDGKPASEVSELCGRILAAFATDPAKFRKLNPDNGWGSFEGAREFITKIKDACDAAPKAVFRCC